jgi:hypothetical protein
MQLQIKKRQAYFIIGFLLIVLVAVIANAAVSMGVDKTKGWHSGRQIEVDISGTTKSLQEAIDAGDFTDNFFAGLNCEIVPGTIPDKDGVSGPKGDAITNIKCPAGKIVTGGGAQFNSNDGGPDLRTEPIEVGEEITEWECHQSESNGGMCYAICCGIATT